ncbi:MAG: PAS domain S-box protein [Methylococcales bacterium]|nr:PAS domain S-box protein [Methylococcales bacterium]
MEQSSNSIVITNLDAVIEYVNPRFTHITGYSKQEAVGQNPRILKSNSTPIAVYEDLWNTLGKGSLSTGIKMAANFMNGQKFSR